MINKAILGLLTSAVLSVAAFAQSHYPVPIRSAANVDQLPASQDMIVVVGLPLEDWPRLQKFTELQHFSIAAEKASNVTNAHVKILSQMNLPKLRDVSLAHRDKVTDEGLQSLSSLRSIESLQLIGLGLTDQGLDLLATRFPRLSGINVEECRGLTTAGFLNLAKSPTLTFVSLSVDPPSQKQIENIMTQVPNVSWWTIADPAKRLDQEALRAFGDARKLIIQVSDANNSVTEITTAKHE